MFAVHPAVRVHEGDGEHVHEMSLDARGKLSEHIWKLENIELATVGIDIGSSTSHLMFANVRLQRKTQALSSQFVVVERKVVWKSPILLTPFLPDGTIDARALGEFIGHCYAQAGLAPQAIDTGAVILTGEAIKRSNARAIADLFAAESGKFVCACAGHHLECVLAAHGSGAAARSREAGPILNVDVGGGTTKLALAVDGNVVSTCAFAVGGRLLAFDAGGQLVRTDEAARLAAESVGVTLGVGDKPDGASIEKVVDALARAAIASIRGDPAAGLARALLLTEPLARDISPRSICFSGGVSEYIDGHERRDFGDIAQALGARIADACRSGAIPVPVIPASERIRATVIGASQFTVQVSGKTIHVSHRADLPLRNVPVAAPHLELAGEVNAHDVAQAIVKALAHSAANEAGPIALAIRWRGEPHYRRLRALAEGIALALAPHDRNLAPVVLMIDGDIGRTLGHILEHEIAFGRDVVSIDGIRLRELDFVDIGEVVRPADVVPVVIKSLLFSGAPVTPHSTNTHYQPLQAARRAAE